MHENTFLSYCTVGIKSREPTVSRQSALVKLLKTNLLKQIFLFGVASPIIADAKIRDFFITTKFSKNFFNFYIMPPMPGLPIAGAGCSSGLSTTRHSVVRNIPAIEAAFSSATRATLAGSITPAARRSSYLSVRAL